MQEAESARMTAALQRATINLTDMRSVKLGVLVHDMELSDLIIGFYSDGNSTILKGEAILHEIVESGAGRSIKVMGLRLANVLQAEMVTAALQLIEGGLMKAPQIEIFGRMLSSVQEGKSTESWRCAK